MEGPLISVIVPIYKVEAYLRQCVDSILAQTYTNLEIILVDDGSPDGCPALCDEYARRDGRVRVIHKENGGLSDARNAGLDMATGEYIGFVDGDDWVEGEMYACLMSTLLKYRADIAVCGYRESNGKRTLATKSLAPMEKQYTVEEAFREVLLSGEILVVMWNKLYKSSLYDDVRFPKGVTFEDGAVFYKLFGKSARIAHTGKIGYNYRKRPGSITFSDYQLLSRNVKDNYYNLEDYIKAQYSSLEKELVYHRLETEYYIIAKYQQAGSPADSSEYEAAMKDMKKNFSMVLCHPRWSLVKKAKAFMLLSGFYMTARSIYYSIKNR